MKRIVVLTIAALTLSSIVGATELPAIQLDDALEEVTIQEETIEETTEEEVEDTTEESAETTEEKTGITGFRGYDWGTTYDDIAADLGIEPTGSGKETATITQNGVSLGGYTADAKFYFKDGVLVAADYDLWMDYTSYEDLVDKYTSVYGEPLLVGYYPNLYPGVVWMDEDQDMILLGGDDSIMYISPESGYYDKAGWGSYFEERYGFNPETALKALENAGNVEGI